MVREIYRYFAGKNQATGIPCAYASDRCVCVGHAVTRVTRFMTQLACVEILESSAGGVWRHLKEAPEVADAMSTASSLINAR
jgi:hypothetical protein